MKAGRRHAAEANAELHAPMDVPRGWSAVALGDVVRLQPGYAFKSTWFVPTGIKLLRGTNIEPGGTRWQDVVYISPVRAEQYATYRLQAGDVVIAMDRPIISTGLKLWS
jgi:type I restriction enzyme S subunit